MIAKARPREPRITDGFVGLIQGRIAEGKRVRRTLPAKGRLHVDRPLPFLCVYRRPARRRDAGTDHLVTTEASYLVASGAPRHRHELTKLLRGVVEALVQATGACLVLEVWAGDPDGNDKVVDRTPRPGFRVLAPPTETGLDRVVDRLETALSRLSLRGERARVEVVRKGAGRAAELLPPRTNGAKGCFVIGLEVDPVFRDPATGEVYPLLLRDLQRELSRALRPAFFEFARKRAGQSAKHYHVLGRRAVVKAVWEVDRGLAAVADAYDMLLQLTPVNAAEAWREFQRKRFQRAPVFRYRPLPVDPMILKRKLHGVPLERVEDPALESLFREKLDELDRQITLMLDTNTERFVHGSLQLFGEMGDGLVAEAHELLDRLPPRSRESSRNGRLDADAFAKLAREEIAFYREQWPGAKAGVEVRNDIASGLMCSGGNLFIGAGSRIPRARADALLQHEVGTHLVTYYNGRAQPFRQLYSGLAGYEALQEGLAVLSEYLVGGLSRPRLRLLAARVVAVQLMIDGATFVDTFRRLNKGYGFEQHTAFTVAMRIYRGGGLTKDAVYLRGLREVLSYLQAGGKLEPLFVGKIALEHVPVIKELRWRGVLRQSPLVPRYLQRPDAAERLDGLRRGVTILDLIEKRHQ
jgi:uncharacterized protein (TIGR02421 family)